MLIIALIWLFCSILTLIVGYVLDFQYTVWFWVRAAILGPIFYFWILFTIFLSDF